MLASAAGSSPLWVAIRCAIAFSSAAYFVRQCRKPAGPLGRLVVALMNRSHSHLTTWALSRVTVADRDCVLDIGCGGGRTLQRLAALASHGRVFGIDYASASVAASRRFNRTAIETGRISVEQASVQQIPFADATFDLATAFETHYYWPDCPAAFREILRVLKPGGKLLVVAEAYRAGGLGSITGLALKMIGGVSLTPDQHRDLFAQAGFIEIDVITNPSKGWLCASGRKPS